ncbi:MAG: hypothetical protein ACP5D2_02070, partial [Candidatus Nanoarchaeia archaeon]
MDKKENREKKKVLKKFLEGLDMKAELNPNPGRFLREKSPKQNKKARRHSGRKTPKLPKPTMKYDEMKQ